LKYNYGKRSLADTTPKAEALMRTVQAEKSGKGIAPEIILGIPFPLFSANTVALR